MSAHALKERISPRSFYRSELPNAPDWPKGKAGWHDGGLCPFHADEHAGSFRVNLGTGGFTCFSCGAKGGSIVDFLMLREGLDFISAVRRLRAEWGR